MAAQFPGENSPTIVARARRLLSAPASEWAAIDAEPMTSGGIFTGWVMPLAAIPPVAQFIGLTVFGYHLFGIGYRPSITSALGMAVISYVMGLVGVVVFAQIINLLAPGFGGTRSSVQAMKVAAYSMTAAWLAGIFALVPALSLLSLAGLYSLYLLYIALPILMKVATEKAVPYALSVILVGLIAGLLLGAIASTLSGRLFAPVGLAGSGGAGTMTMPDGSNVDLGKLNAAADKLKAAGEAMEKGKTNIVPAQTLQDLLPATVSGWTRGEVQSQSGSAGGIGGSQAEAHYTSGDQSFRLSVTDVGAMGALATLGGALNARSSRQTATGYEKAEVIDGRMTNEKWDNAAHSGNYSVMVAGRFMVEAQGSAPSIDILKGAVAAVDPARLEALAK